MPSFSQFDGNLYDLTFVDFGTTLVRGETANTMMFVLSGVLYTVSEDPDDGYRSHASDDITVEVLAYTPAKSFPPCRVMASFETSGDREVLVLTDVGTGQPVVEVGTLDANDYYPYFVSRYHPENMSQNSKTLEEDPNKDKYWYEVLPL